MDKEEKCFLTKQDHDNSIHKSESETYEHKKGHKNAMIASQRQLNLRNRDVILFNPQKKVIENKTYTSELNKTSDPKGVTNSQSKGK